MRTRFILNQHLFLALVRHDPAPIVTALGEQPEIPEANRWANFIKNHDELTLDKLTEAEREEVFAALAPDPDMRSFGRGIRRRVPPMLDGDRRRIELLYSLLFTLPGTPVLLYGEEIGLGDDQRVEGRAAVRVAMQWTAGPAAGFTTGDPDRLLAEVLANRRDDPVEAGRPLALDGYGYRWLRLPPAESG